MNALVNDNAERTLLGCALVDPGAIHRVFSAVRPTDFSLPAYQLIASSMVRMAEAGKPVDVLTVTDDLGTKGQLKTVGGVSFLTSLQENLSAGLARAENLEHYAAIVAEKSRRRQARVAAERLIAQADDASVDTDTCLHSISESLLEIEAASAKHTARPLKEILPEVLRELDAQAKNAGLVGMPTGIGSLDLATGGHRPGELITVGALPGRGKSAFGAQAMLANGNAGNPTCLFSLEMSATEVAKRFLAAQSNIPAFKIRNPSSIGKDRWPDLLKAMGDVADLPIFIDASPSLKLHELIARAKLYVRRYGVKLIIVDHLRHVDAPGRDLREQVGNVADGLRQFAKSEQVGVLLLSQLRRPAGGINARPDMLQIKESGDVEAHSHVVLLLYMPVAEDGTLLGEAEVIIGKNRNGAVGALPVYFDSKMLTFRERTDSR